MEDPMGQIIVTDLDDQTIARLQERARLANQSLEHTIRTILIEAAMQSKAEIWAEIAALRNAAAATHGAVTPDATVLIREDRER
jgi:hypothetical protein